MLQTQAVASSEPGNPSPNKFACTPLRAQRQTAERMSAAEFCWISTATLEATMATSYADGAQAREWDRRYDAWGRDKRPRPDEFHDYEAAEQLRTQALADRAAREIEERKSLRRRIGLAMAQMETICPPNGGAA